MHIRTALAQHHTRRQTHTDICTLRWLTVTQTRLEWALHPRPPERQRSPAGPAHTACITNQQGVFSLASAIETNYRCGTGVVKPIGVASPRSHSSAHHFRFLGRSCHFICSDCWAPCGHQSSHPVGRSETPVAHAHTRVKYTPPSAPTRQLVPITSD